MTGPLDAPALVARGLVVTFGTNTVLDGVDLDVRHGEILALVGPNGAGKSTLLAVLSGDLEPDQGKVEFLGRPLDDWRLRDLSRERAVLTQEHHVAFPFRVTEVVAMGRAPWHGRPEEDDDEAVVEESMLAMDVGHLAARPFGVLSGGEKGRTAFARVLAQRTGVLLLDEPTAALDIGHQEAVLTRARHEAESGSAVVVVLHDLTLAAAWCDRVLLLDSGRVAGEGAPRDVFGAALLSEVYDFPVEVVAHPVTGDLLVLPDRRSVTGGLR